MRCKFKYIHMVRANKQNPRTWIYLVRVNYDETLLGTIKWYAQWRKYGFYPEAKTVFEDTCLEDIKQFCIDLNERQRSRSKRK